MKKDHQKIINYIQPSLYDVSDTIFIHTTENFGRNYENVLRENYFRDFNSLRNIYIFDEYVPFLFECNLTGRVLNAKQDHNKYACGVVNPFKFH